MVVCSLDPRVGTQNYRWQNGKLYYRKMNSEQSALARRVRQGWTGPPCFAKFWQKIFLTFCETQNKNVCKNFAKLQKQKFCSHPTPTQSAVCCLSLTLLSDKRFFNVARQCYFEMKTNMKSYFSILSSILLWSWLTSSTGLASFLQDVTPFNKNRDSIKRNGVINVNDV